MFNLNADIEEAVEIGLEWTIIRAEVSREAQLHVKGQKHTRGATNRPTLTLLRGTLGSRRVLLPRHGF